MDEYRRSSIFEAATQACVDCEAETQAVVDVGDAGDNAKNKVGHDGKVSFNQCSSYVVCLAVHWGRSGVM